MKYRAYWLNTNGDVVPVETIHIMEVIKNPERFNYTREQIEAVYTQYKEPMGHEGKAREKIMQNLIKNYGWIRLRFKPAEDLWTIELHTLTDDIHEHIRNFFKQADVVDKSIYANLRITELFKAGGMKHHKMSLSQLIQGETQKSYYLKINEIDPQKSSALLKDALTESNITVPELAKQLHYCSLERSELKIVKILEGFADDNDLTILRTIADILKINSEEFIGEKRFANYEEYLEEFSRLNFVPHLVRVPTETRPSQITSFGFVGFEKAFVVGRYKNLLNKPLHEQLKYIGKKCQNDTTTRKDVIFFGKKLGYAFYWDYEQPAVALSLSGNVLENTVVTYNGVSSSSVSIKAKTIIETGSFQIPRLSTKEQILEKQT